MPSHRLIHQSLPKPPVVKTVPKAAAGAPAWPSYPGGGTLVGTSPSGRCTVYYDASLGAPCLQNATDLVADADRVFDANDALFGTKGGHVDVIVFALGGATDGTGGADHMGCDFQTGAQIEVCASFGQSMRVSALFEAELSECSMNGQLCGSSTGEALSRWCAMAVSNNALADFATAPTWFADGMPNFVDTVDPTDQNADSTGCGMCFISWLMAGRAVPLTLTQIAEAMVNLGDGGTLAALYAQLTKNPAPDAWAAFSVAITSQLSNGVTSDDPFNALGTPQPQPQPGPGPGTSALELAVLIGQALFADLGNGADEPTMKADIQAILDAN
jgi:hypothetical protein